LHGFLLWQGGRASRLTLEKLPQSCPAVNAIFRCRFSASTAFWAALLLAASLLLFYLRTATTG